MPTKNELEIAAWNPLILDDKKILISTKDEEALQVQQLFKRARKNFPKHDLTFRYGWPHKEPEDHLCGMIGTALEEAFLDELLSFLGLEGRPLNDSYKEGQRDSNEDYRKSVDYWWPRSDGKKMTPLAYFKMPASYEIIRALTSVELEYSMMTAYGHTGHEGNPSVLAMPMRTTFIVFTATHANFDSWEPTCRVMAKADLDSLAFRVKHNLPIVREEESVDPTKWWLLEEEVAKRRQFVKDILVNELGYGKPLDGEDCSIVAPKEWLGTPQLMVATDCRHLNYKYKFAGPAKDYDYHSCGKLGYKEFDKCSDFNLDDEVCSMFGAPASQQEARRPLNPDNWGYGQALIPFLNFTDQQHDMTYQYYADPHRMHYCNGYKGYGWIDASCT